MILLSELLFKMSSSRAFTEPMFKNMSQGKQRGRQRCMQACAALRLSEADKRLLFLLVFLFFLSFVTREDIGVPAELKMDVTVVLHCDSSQLCRLTQAGYW